MSVLRLIYRFIEKNRKPSVERELQWIREMRGKRQKGSAYATERKGRPHRLIKPAQSSEPIEEVLRRDWELISSQSAPHSPHVSEEELQLLLKGRDLAPDRDAHYAECKLCHELVHSADPTNERAKQIAKALATPPWFAGPKPETAGTEEADLAEEDVVSVEHGLAPATGRRIRRYRCRRISPANGGHLL